MHIRKTYECSTTSTLGIVAPIGGISLDYIVRYLTNPLKIGVFNIQLLVDLSGLEQLFGDIGKFAKKRKMEWARFKKEADEVKQLRPWTDIMEKFKEAIMSLAVFDECPEEVLKYFGIERSTLKRIRPVHRRDYIAGSSRGKVLRSRVFFEIPDATSIEIIKRPVRDPRRCLVDITSVKKEGFLKVKRFIKGIPHIGKKTKEIKQTRTFSSRYTFRPYPLSVQLWLTSEASLRVPKDLKDFLSGAVRYHSSREWRTSIVLSAITTESILADLYEEEYKENAPSVPLGDLYHKVKEKIDFPTDTARAVEMVNESRIAAVHRSRFPVSDREAINALFGATTFAIWYSSNY